jgi:mannosyltransferase OCH1-like enzyme
MKINYKLVLSFLLVSFSVSALEDVNFDQSSGLDLMEKYSIEFDEPIESVNLKLKLLRENYERNKPSKMVNNQAPIIPKIIHSIWLGNASLSKNYLYYFETWRKFHPDWQIKLWNEKEILKENFSNIDLYLLAESYQEKSDIIRYEILRKYGGLFIDSDIECFANFDNLHHKYDFYGYMETPAINKYRVNILNGMFASIPNHPILSATLAKIRKDWNKAALEFEQKYSTDEQKFKRSRHFLAVIRTMYPFGEVVYQYLQQNHQAKIIILPTGYGFPLYFVDNNGQKGFFKKIFSRQPKFSAKNIIRPETMSFHHYSKANSLMEVADFSKSLLKQSMIPKKIKAYLKAQDKYFMNFKDLFDNNFPTQLPYETVALIPEIIYLNNSTNLAEQEFAQLKQAWQKTNQFFEIRVITDAELIRFLPKELEPLNPELKKLLSLFFLLNKNGGVYIESGFKPANLQEFNYKYRFYGKLFNLSSILDEMKLDLGLIAAQANHSIIHNFIRDVEDETIRSESLTTNKINNLYLENIYKYNQLDGKNIVFPESIFEQKR